MKRLAVTGEAADRVNGPAHVGLAVKPACPQGSVRFTGVTLPPGVGKHERQPVGAPGQCLHRRQGIDP